MVVIVTKSLYILNLCQFILKKLIIIYIVLNINIPSNIFYGINSTLVMYTNHDLLLFLKISHFSHQSEDISQIRRYYILKSLKKIHFYFDIFIFYHDVMGKIRLRLPIIDTSDTTTYV